MEFSTIMQRKPLRRNRGSCLVVAAALCAGAGSADAFDVNDRRALWFVVNDLCRPMQRLLGSPRPCLKVDLAHGFIVLRAPGETTQILIAPTARIEGIESSAILKEGAPNLWALAWAERNRVAASAPRPLQWDDVGMAINSRRGRSQDQLHIHVDCVDFRLKRALAARAFRPSPNWSRLDPGPWASRYRVKYIAAAGLEKNIFKMVAEEIPGAKAKMARQAIAVVGVGAKDDRGFAVLASSDGDGHAEELLDHSCAAGK